MLLLRAVAGLLALSQFALAAERTKNIDDAGGDSTTRISLGGSWAAGQDCEGCFVKPDRGKAFGGTWRDATFTPGGTAPTVTVEFEGTGLSVFCILANQVPFADTLANYAFTIDGRASGSPFVHAAEDTTEYQYNARVFSVTGLSNGKHTFVLTPRGSASVLILFDYVTVTFEVPDPVISTSSSSITRPTTETTRVTETTTRTTINTSQETNTATGTSPSSSNSVEDTRTRQFGSTDTLPTTSLPTSTPGTASGSADDAQQSEDTSGAAAVPIAPIVGGVVGGLAFLFLIVVVLFMRRRRKQRVMFTPSEAQYTDFDHSTGPFGDPLPGPPPLTGSSFGNAAGAAMAQTNRWDSNGYWNTFSPNHGPTYQPSETSGSAVALAPLRRQITPRSYTPNSGSGQYSNIASGMGSAVGSDRAPSEPAVMPSESSATADHTLPYLRDSKPAYLYEGSISSRRPYSISNPTPEYSTDAAPPMPPLPVTQTTHTAAETELLRQRVDLLQAEIEQLRGRDAVPSLLPPSYRDAVA